MYSYELINFIYGQMRERKITQKEMAAKIHVSDSTMSHYFNHLHAIPLDMAFAMLHVMGLDLAITERRTDD